MLVEVEITEDLVDVPGQKPTLGLCGLCERCNLELSVTGTWEERRHKLLALFPLRCPAKASHRYAEALMDDRHNDPQRED